MVDADRGVLSLLQQPVPLTLPMAWDVPTIRVGRALAELEIHYLEFLRDLDDARFTAFCRDWIVQNGVPKGPWWNRSWNCYGLSIRCVVWMQELAARWARLEPAFRDQLCREVYRQIRFLRGNLELDLGGNHLLKDIVALLWAGRFFEGDEPDEWTQRGTDLLGRELPEQMLPDGMHFERSPAYHAIVLGDLLDCQRLLQPSPLLEELNQVIHRARQALADLTHPDGMVSLCNDGGLHKAPPVATVLGASPPAARSVFGLQQAGYFGLRTQDQYFLADCGPIAPDHLPAHGHGDILAFEWTVDGKRIVTDWGVYEYTAGPWRELSRATRSHNTVTVDDADQCEFWSSFRVGRRARILEQVFEPRVDGFRLTGSHDGFRRQKGRPIHRRIFDVGADEIVIQDEVIGGRGQAVRSRLLFHPDCELRLGPGGLRVEHTGTVLAVLFQCEGHLQDNWWCPDFGVKLPTRQLVLEYGSAPCKGSFRLRRGEP